MWICVCGCHGTYLIVRGTISVGPHLQPCLIQMACLLLRKSPASASHLTWGMLEKQMFHRSNVGSGDLNSEPRACMAKCFTHWTISSPTNVFWQYLLCKHLLYLAVEQSKVSGGKMGSSTNAAGTSRHYLQNQKQSRHEPLSFIKFNPVYTKNAQILHKYILPSQLLRRLREEDHRSRSVWLNSLLPTWAKWWGPAPELQKRVGGADGIICFQ